MTGKRVREAPSGYGAETAGHGLYFLDTNVVVYAYDRSAPPAKRESAQRLLRDAVQSGHGVISAQVLSEFSVTVLRKFAQPLPLSLVEQICERLSAMRVVEIDAALVRSALLLMRTHQLSLWDAQILVAAERAGCAVLWSEDLTADGVYGAVTVRRPW